MGRTIGPIVNETDPKTIKTLESGNKIDE